MAGYNQDQFKRVRTYLLNLASLFLIYGLLAVFLFKIRLPKALIND